MKLLYVCNETASFASHRLPIARAAVAAGWDVSLAAKATGSVSAILAQGVKVIDLNIDATGVNPFRDLKTMRDLGRIVSQLQPNLMHAITIKPVIYGGALARWHGIPLVSAICGTGQPSGIVKVLARTMSRYGLGHPKSTTIFQNETDHREFARLCTATAMIRGAGVDLDHFRPDPDKVSAQPCMVVMPARMIEAKGVRDFVEAARLLRDEGVDAVFALVGGSPEANRGAIPAKLIEQWSAAGVIEWWGHQADMRAVYRDADIVCLPSRGGEGVPKALLEAIACGLPVVTTDVPGCRDVVMDGVNGLVVPPRSSNDLASALYRLISDPARRQQAGADGRTLAERNFGIDAVVEQHMRIYGELHCDRSTGRGPWKLSVNTRSTPKNSSASC